MSGLDIVIIIFFIILNIVIGIYSSRNLNNFSQFAVGQRSFGTFAIFATLSASFIGGGYTLGNAKKVFNMGMIYAFALLGFSLKELFIGFVLAPRMDRFSDCYSVGDIIGKQYGKIAKITTGVFAVLVCAGILGAQVNAMGQIIEAFFTIDPKIGVLLGFGIIILYCTVGGMRAVVYTDILQFLILVIALPALFFIGLKTVGGWSEVVERTPASFTNPLDLPNFWVLFIPLFLTFMFGESTVPPYIQRLIMAKQSKTTKRAVIASGFLSIPFFLIVGGLGLIALLINPSINPNQSIPYLINVLLSPGIKGIVVVGLISVIMSSASGFLNAAAISAIHDIITPLSKNTFTMRYSLLWARLTTLVVGILALVFAFSFNNVIDVLVYAYNFWSPIVLVPLVAVICGFSVTARDFWFGVSFGLIAITGCQLQHAGSIWANNPVVIGVFANLLGFVCSGLLRDHTSSTEQSSQPSRLHRLGTRMLAFFHKP
ncbi:sodium:solute symporter family protein [Kistimonas scapharcae]|uniref:Sodium:solute symporter family protein n=1 Tax=Kistimonas scapharcae TaxID=1036133 RepID=A0ABP8V5R8_9GAMM